jgi:tRNA A-37 threonylcarbamoyl transferase component Bud32
MNDHDYRSRPAPPAPRDTMPLAAGEAAPGALRHFGDYELLEEIARGGMGVVYKARQASVNRVVALKMIRAGQLASPEDVARFQREAEAAAGLDHPNIVPLYEVGEHEGQHYFTMKLVAGGSLAQHLGQSPRPAIRELVGLMVKVVRAVHHAHQRGVIHRDLKPANVLVDEQGEPHLTDFGLARPVEAGAGLTCSGAIVGTPGYMAPEQARPRKGGVTTLTDVYALGAILYEILTGRPPFPAETPFEAVLAVLEKDPEPPSRIDPGVDRDLEAVCLKCLARDPQARYPSAAALADDLAAWLAGAPLSVRPPSAAYLAWLWLRKNVRAALWVVLVGALGGGLAALLYLGPSLLGLLANVDRAYESLPGAHRPWLARLGRDIAEGLPDSGWLAVPRQVALCLCFCGMGLFVVLLVRPRDRWAALGASLGVGLVAGVTSFALAVGPWVTWQRLVRPNKEHLVVLAYGTFEPQAQLSVIDEETGQELEGPLTPQEWLFREWPGLGDVPDGGERAHRLQARLTADMAVNAFLSTWIGLLLALGACVVPTVCQALAAHALLRRGGRVLLPYFELSYAWSWLLLDLISALVVAPLLGQRTVLTAWGLGALVSLTALATVGVARGWGWPLRWLLYGAWLATLQATGGGWSHSYTGVELRQLPPWLTVANLLVTYGGAALLLAGRYARRRKSRPADTLREAPLSAGSVAPR